MSKDHTLYFRADEMMRDRVELERAAAQKRAGAGIRVSLPEMIRALVNEALDARASK
jgi:hypothetical protein